MARGYAFRARWWALTLAAAACCAGIALGNWQTRRAEEKRELGARLERIAVDGEFVPQYTVYLDNKVRRGKPGYEVVTPLKLRGSLSHVLVNRGWVEAASTRDTLPEVPTPGGAVRIEGLSLDRLPRSLQLKEEAKSRVRQNLDVDAYSAETGLRLQPRVIEQHSNTPDGLARDWPPHDAGIEKHEGYALQWYALAALAVVLAVVFSFRRSEDPSK
jgi:surfeit locus 1 family protein